MNFKFTPFQGFVTIIGLLVALGFAYNLIATEIERRNCNPVKEDCSKFGVDSRDYGIRR